MSSKNDLKELPKEVHELISHMAKVASVYEPQGYHFSLNIDLPSVEEDKDG